MLSGIRHVIGTSGGVILIMSESLSSVTIREFLDQLEKDSTLPQLYRVSYDADYNNINI